MKTSLLTLMLIILVSLSAAVLADPSPQAGYSPGSMDFGQMTTTGSSGPVATVIIKDNSFQPSVLNVPAGVRVEWHNQDPVQHSVVSDIQGLFNSGVIMPGGTYSFTFSVPNSYGYHCGIHQGMQGTVVITGSAATGRWPSAVAGATDGPSQIASEAVSSASWSEQPISLSEPATYEDSQSGSESAINFRSLPLASTTSTIPSSVGQPSGHASGEVSALSSSQEALQMFSQYYRSASEAPQDQLTTPVQVNLNDIEPDTLYFGSTQKAVPYSQYQTYALSTGLNSLWIAGATSSWTQYAVVPLGSQLSMIAISPSGSSGYLYEVYPAGSLVKNGYSFYPYNQIGFYADKVGEHQLFFNIAGQPSNVIVIDVVPYQQIQPVYNFAAITVSSTWLRGYNLYIDGIYKATEGMTGDPAGVIMINVAGDQYHNIAIDGSGLTFSDYKYFRDGYAYKLNV
jgi:plastocyanin